MGNLEPGVTMGLSSKVSSTRKAGPIEATIRQVCYDGMALQTPMKPRPFEVSRINEQGVTLLLGAKQTTTLMSWECIEGVSGFLRGRGWVKSGGVHSVDTEPGTLDA